MSSENNKRTTPAEESRPGESHGVPDAASPQEQLPAIETVSRENGYSKQSRHQAPSNQTSVSCLNEDQTETKNTVNTPENNASPEARRQKGKPRGRFGYNLRFKRLKSLKNLNNLWAGLALAALCFLLSYGFASLFYLNRQVQASGGLSLKLIAEYSQNNILILLFLVASISCLMTLLFLALSAAGRKLSLLVRSGFSLRKFPARPEPESAVQNGVNTFSEMRYSSAPAAAAQNAELGSDDNRLAQDPQPEITTNTAWPGIEELEDTDVPLFAPHSGEQLHSQAEDNTTPASTEDPTVGDPTLLPPTQYYDIENRNGQFYANLHFLLHKKFSLYVQGFTVVLSSLACALITLGFLGQVPGKLLFLFSILFLFIGALFTLILRNQYSQGMEALYQNLLQQIYQHSSPTNSYKQLDAISMLYGLAFVEARYFQARVIAEFQNVLKLTRSSWYQARYSQSPSILVEEVLRKLLSAVDFCHLLLGGRTKPDTATFYSTMQNLFREWLYHRLFLKDFQKFGAFRHHATVGLLSHMDKLRQASGSRTSLDKPPNGLSQPPVQDQRILPYFVLENYYLVGTNLSKLRVTEAHFQNCQLSHSNWSGSKLSDCSISSCHLDQVILYRSSWRRFLWAGNTAREIDVEHCSFLQGNLRDCDLQGIQNPLDSHWHLRHCLLQECRLGNSTISIDCWQNVKASSCDWSSTLLSIAGELYSPESEAETETLSKHLEIKA